MEATSEPVGSDTVGVWQRMLEGEAEHDNEALDDHKEPVSVEVIQVREMDHLDERVNAEWGPTPVKHLAARLPIHRSCDACARASLTRAGMPKVRDAVSNAQTTVRYELEAPERRATSKGWLGSIGMAYCILSCRTRTCSPG